METPMSLNEETHDEHGRCCEQGGAGCGRRSFGRCSVGWWVIKAMVSFVILVMVFSFGVHAGTRLSGRQGMRRPTGMMWQQGWGAPTQGNAPRGGMMGGFGRGQQLFLEDAQIASGTVRLVGSITKIEGNRLTIVDDAAKEWIVLFGSTTKIFTQAGDGTLASLRVGQSMMVNGVMGQDGSLTAMMARLF